MAGYSWCTHGRGTWTARALVIGSNVKTELVRLSELLSSEMVLVKCVLLFYFMASVVVYRHDTVGDP